MRAALVSIPWHITLDSRGQPSFLHLRLLFHLKSLLTGTAAARSDAGKPSAIAKPETPSIAVLPFANLSPDPDQEYFCDGRTEEIIAALSKIRGLRVISRNSAMTLKGTRKTTREIGELLHIGHVLEGSVRKSGNNVRIVAQLEMPAARLKPFAAWRKLWLQIRAMWTHSGTSRGATVFMLANLKTSKNKGNHRMEGFTFVK